MVYDFVSQLGIVVILVLSIIYYQVNNSFAVLYTHRSLPLINQSKSPVTHFTLSAHLKIVYQYLMFLNTKNDHSKAIFTRIQVKILIVSTNRQTHILALFDFERRTI